MLEEEYKNLLDNIVWLRNHYEFSIERMADIMGISIEMINEIENGKMPQELTVEAIFNMQDFFRIEPQDLLGQSLKRRKIMGSTLEGELSQSD